MLMIREPAGPQGDLVRGGGNALVLGENGDAKLLEIGGTASAAVIEYVRTLRELALEGVHGNRSSADRFAAAQSENGSERYGKSEARQCLANSIAKYPRAADAVIPAIAVPPSSRYDARQQRLETDQPCPGALLSLPDAYPQRGVGPCA
jgi:hypothetical protein